MNTQKKDGINQFLEKIEPLNLDDKIAGFVVALKMMDCELFGKVGIWNVEDNLIQTLEYSLLFDEKFKYEMSKVSFVYKENEFKMFVVRVDDSFVDTDKFAYLIGRGEGFQTIYDKGMKIFVINCYEVSLIDGMLNKLIECIKK